MKKWFVSLFILGLLLSGVVGCGSTPTTTKATTPADKEKEKKGTM